MLNSITSKTSSISIKPNSDLSGETSKLTDEILQIQNSDENIETQRANDTHSASQLTTSYKREITNDFWAMLQNELSHEEFYAKFKEFIYSNWTINEELQAKNLPVFCQNKTNQEKYQIYNQSCFQSGLKQKAVRIFCAIGKCIELDLKNECFNNLEATQKLNDKQDQIQKNLKGEKTRNINKMGEFYCQAYDTVYKYYIEHMKNSSTNITDETLTNFIKESSKKRNEATKRTNLALKAIRMNLIETFTSKIDNYIFNLEKYRATVNTSIATASETSSLQIFHTNPSKTKLNGKEIDVKLGRIIDIIENKIKEQSITAIDRDYILHPTHVFPKRYYLTKIPITDIECKIALMNLKFGVFYLLKIENKHPKFETDIKLIQDKFKIFNRNIKNYVNLVLEHQKYIEIAYSEKKNVYLSNLKASQAKSWVNRKRKTLFHLEKKLRNKKENFNSTIKNTKITEEHTIDRLLQLFNTEAANSVYEVISQPEYNELTGIQVKKKEILSPSIIVEPATSTSISEKFKSDFLLSIPPKEYKKEDLSDKERKIFDILYEKIRANKIINEIDVKKGTIYNYYSSRKRFYLQWYQIISLELKISLANFIINKAHRKTSITIKNKEEKFLSVRVTRKIKKYVKYALKYLMYSDLHKNIHMNTCSTKEMKEWMRVSSIRIKRNEKNLNATQEELTNTLQNSRMTVKKFDSQFEYFIDSKAFQNQLIDNILHILSKEKSSTYSNIITTPNTNQTCLKIQGKRAHGDTFNQDEPQEKKIKYLSNEKDIIEDNDKIDEDYLLTFLNNLHNNELTNTDLTKDCQIDEEFIKSLLSETDLSSIPLAKEKFPSENEDNNAASLDIHLDKNIAISKEPSDIFFAPFPSTSEQKTTKERAHSDLLENIFVAEAINFETQASAQENESTQQNTIIFK